MREIPVSGRRAPIEQAAGGDEEHPDADRHQQRTVSMPLAQVGAVAFQQFGRRGLGQARRDNHGAHLMTRAGVRVERYLQLPLRRLAPMANAQLWPLQRPQLMAQAIGHGKQVGQAMDCGQLRAGIDQHANFQSVLRRCHCQFFPPICRSRQSASAPLKPITITTPQPLPRRRRLK
ncbi:hypothetical protein D3C84_824260 [compost metagenome]